MGGLVYVYASIILNVNCPVQEGKTISSDITPKEGFHFLGFDFNQLSSTYLNQGLGAVPAEEIRALLSTSYI